MLYFALASAAFSFWYFSSSGDKFTTAPLLFGFGSLALLVKGVFLLRKSSEGLGLTEQDLADLSASVKSKKLPQLPEQAAQILQDFGAGPMLLWPLLSLGADTGTPWSNSPRPPIFLTGAVLFGLGWLIRRLTKTASA